jgi:glucosamine--fructose-6-phosphate aminotransferase (isomerizing)
MISDTCRKEMVEGLYLIPEKMETILMRSEEIKGLAFQYHQKKDFLYLGRSFAFPIALEGALKLKEISYIHAEGYPAGEMKHGPIALIDEEMPVVALTPMGRTYDKILSNIEEVKARSGTVIAIASEGDDRIREKADHVFYIPDASEELNTLLMTIPLQLLAYYIADYRGCDIDQPRNLAKSVTVE